MDVGFSGFICVVVFGDTLRIDVPLLSRILFSIIVYYIYSPFNIIAI